MAGLAAAVAAPSTMVAYAGHERTTTMAGLVGPAIRVPLVGVLGRCGYPATIGRFVVPVVVGPVDGQVIAVPVRHRPIAKRWEGLPSGTHSDPSPVIVTVLGFGRIAPQLHPLPNPVQPGPALGMFGDARDEFFSAHAPAICRPSRCQRRRLNGPLFATFAAACPRSVTGHGLRPRDHCPPAERVTNGYIERAHERRWTSRQVRA